jgi:hypothetical protein
MVVDLGVGCGPGIEFERQFAMVWLEEGPVQITPVDA